VLWEVDTGARRLGTPPGEASADAILELVRDATNLQMVGLFSSSAHAYAAIDAAAVRDIARAEDRDLRQTAEALSRRRVLIDTVSVGSTPPSLLFDQQATPTQVRPGNYVFNDATQVALGVAEPADCALSVLGTVLSRPGGNRAIVDAGSKALTAERMTPLTPFFGSVIGRPDLRVERLYEEHAVIVGDGVDLRVGDRVRIVPNHACTTVNLHDRMLVVDGAEIVDEWAVAARGQ
jgi:D-serine deaminase-like pyridoxal phosphate-dependent protein